MQYAENIKIRKILKISAHSVPDLRKRNRKNFTGGFSYEKI